ncbi:sugar ABC transporter substrate-binding protein [Lachnospiraceae bacterium ZAX-1]
MKAKKIQFGLVATLAAATILAACGSSSDNGGSSSGDSSGTSGDTSSDTDSKADDAKSDDAKSDGGGSITFYGFSDWVDTDPYKAVYQEVKAKFEEENPGYTVELQSDPWGDWEQKYKTMFASGNAADVFMVNNPDFPVFANSGNLLDIGEYAKSGYFDQFFPGVLSMYTWNGKNMAVPFTTDCRILWYNKEMFKEAGLDPESPPTTWEELVKYANQITEKTGKYGFGMDMGLKELPTASLFCASGSTLITVDNDGKITPNVDTDEFKGYLQTLLDMKATYEPDYPNLIMHDVAKQFAEGQFGIIIGNTLTETDIYEKDFWGQALVPTMSAGTDKGSFGGGFGISVSSETKNPEQAVKFAQMMVDAQYNAGLVSDIPASEEGMNHSTYVSDEKFEIVLEQIQYAKQSMPKTLYYAEIEAAAYDTVVEVVVGGSDINTAVQDLTAKIEEIIQQ